VEHSGELEKALLGARLELTRREVAAEAGVALEQAQQVWSAMGLPEVPDDERAFTGRDVDALRTFAGLRSSGLVDVETSLVLARAMGQGLSRLAEAQVEAFRALSAGMTLQEATEVATTSAEQVMPRLEQLVVHVWRRQFAAAVTRSLAYAGQEGLPVLAVGFVDLVDFTRSVRSWDSATLQWLLERFERDTSLRVTAPAAGSSRPSATRCCTSATTQPRRSRWRCRPSRRTTPTTSCLQYAPGWPSVRS